MLAGCAAERRARALAAAEARSAQPASSSAAFAIDLTDDDASFAPEPPRRSRKRPAAPLCSVCRLDAPSPGFEWCSSCYADHCQRRDRAAGGGASSSRMCAMCDDRPANPGFHLCQAKLREWCEGLVRPRTDSTVRDSTVSFPGQ
jgi:hypothetical protein